MSSPIMPSAAAVTKKRRVHASLADCCRTCRLRKVKCTGKSDSGPCTNCGRLSLSCSFTESNADSESDAKVSRSTPSQSHTEAGTLRKRAQRACNLCHSHKTKCSGDLPKCKRCALGGLQCEYTPAKRKFTNLPQQKPRSPSEHQAPAPVNHQSPRTSESPVSLNQGTGNADSEARAYRGPSAQFLLLQDVSILTSTQQMMRKDLILQHFDAYLEHLYYIPSMGVFHPKTTLQQIQDGTFDPVKAAALCCVTSFFVNPGRGAREFGAKCSEMLEMHLFQNISNFEPSILLLAALTMAYNFLNMSFAKVWTCMGAATRIMVALQANWDGYTGGASFIEQECLRRVVWEIWYLDTLLAGGYDEYTSCRRELMKIRLPCDEIAFREGRPVVAERLHDLPDKPRGSLGWGGWQVRLADVRHRIQVATRKLMPGANTDWSRLEPSQIMAEINGFQNELNRIHASLPEDIRLSDASIARYISSEERAGYVYLHGHLSVSHMDLYRFALPNLLEQSSAGGLPHLPPEFISKCQKQSVGHALCLARYYEVIQSLAGNESKNGMPALVADCTVGHMTTNCMRILLVGLRYNLFDDIEKLTTAPLWRYQAPTEVDVRRMIESMLRITEPWCEIVPLVQTAHNFNLTMLDNFDKNRIIDANSSPIFPAPNLSTHASGRPKFGVDMQAVRPPSVLKDEDQYPVGEEPLDRWSSNKSPFAVEDLMQRTRPLTPNVDVKYAPPGMPAFLAQVRGGPSAVSSFDSIESAPELSSFPNSRGTTHQSSKPPQWAVSNMVNTAPFNQMAPLESAQTPQPVSQPSLGNFPPRAVVVPPTTSGEQGNAHLPHQVSQQQQQQSPLSFPPHDSQTVGEGYIGHYDSADGSSMDYMPSGTYG